MSDTCTNEVVLNKVDTHFTEMVNARDLYDQLEINKDFSNWMKQNINTLGLLENVDYVKFAHPTKGSKNNNFDHDTIRSKTGSNSHNVPTRDGKNTFAHPTKASKTGSGGHNIIHYGLTYAAALIIAAKRKGPIGIQMLQHIKTIINNQTTLYIEYKDKHDLYMGGDYEYTIADTAKMFGIPGFGQNKFKSWLRTEGYILSDDTPAQKEVSAGHMRLIFKELPNGNEVPVILISKQGVDFYSKKLGMIRVSYLNYEKEQKDAADFILNM